MPISKETQYFVINSEFQFQRRDVLTSSDFSFMTVTLVLGNQSTFGTFTQVRSVPYVEVYLTHKSYGVNSFSGGNVFVINGWSVAIESILPKYDPSVDTISYVTEPIRFTYTDPFHRELTLTCKATIEDITRLYKKFVNYSATESLLTAKHEVTIMELTDENARLRSLLEDIQSKIPSMF
ncbi:hypothetical protein [Mucilaginibacter boryungensis]|uniref:Uncharacterized protein n=1 Tax=Mucilaginibacter boryungensis TaxID=768480 RepID=A0ABR9XMW8_9SPHI|nr:hypothetical protein [Mucilaginibacter boryungensis]MBE9668721.1 hypothetical protein [Mucilaginibacter boryungensis]